MAPLIKRKPSPQSGRRAEPQRRQVLHLYGISQGAIPPAKSFEDLKGVDGSAAVEALSCGGLLCWISRVPEEEFASGLAKNMQDLDWLATVSTRHQQVVSAIAQATDMLPARFGIEFLNENSLASHVRAHEDSLAADLRRIRGKEEWGVKVFSAPATAAPVKRVRTGKEYLQAKSALARRNGRSFDRTLVEFGKALESIADQVGEGGKFAGARRDLAFHKTVLLKKNDRKKLQALVNQYSKKWKNQRRIECTGPWPTFSFVSSAELPASGQTHS